MSENFAVSQKTALCDRCQCSFDLDEGHNECLMRLCKTCYNDPSITPGQYMYALHLWHWHENVKKPTEPLPVFWPKDPANKPLSPHALVSSALGDDTERLPCGIKCSCMHIPKKLQDPQLMFENECIFLKLKESSFRTLLLLHWWYSYYDPKSPHPEFWPTLDTNKLLAPKKLVANTLKRKV